MTHGIHRRSSGFTLIELSIVMVIIGIILSIGAGVIKSLYGTSVIRKNKQQLDNIENAIYGFVVSKGRLPCPDVDGDGKEDCPATSCSRPPCYLPFIDLQVDPVDAWARPFYYDVTNKLTVTNKNNFCILLYDILNVIQFHPFYPKSCQHWSVICSTLTGIWPNSDPNDGNINRNDSGYYLSAIVISGGANKQLDGKNAPDARREYELASNTANDDFVKEITLTKLLDRVCRQEDIKMTVTGAGTNGTRIQVYFAMSDEPGQCIPLHETQKLAVYPGQSVTFYPRNDSNCTGTVFKKLVFFDGQLNLAYPNDMIDHDIRGGSFNWWDGEIFVSDGNPPVITNH